MSDKDDGGAAFPTSTDCYGGLTVRDWFAAQALNGMLAHSTRYQPRQGSFGTWHNAISVEAYEIADAMLAERERGLSRLRGPA